MGRQKDSKKVAAAPPTAYHHGDLREALIRAGIEILEEKGLAALTLRETARRAGVSHAAPYHHFADKNSLLAGIAHRGFEIQREEMAQSAKGSSRATDGLQAYGMIYAIFAQRHPALFRLMYSQQRFTPDPQGDLDRASTGVYPEMIDGIRQATGCDEEEAKMVGLLLWSAMHGLAMLWLEEQLQTTGEKSIEPLARRITELLGRAMPQQDPPL
jgi:AcrR family transcriptional regulator